MTYTEMSHNRASMMVNGFPHRIVGVQRRPNGVIAEVEVADSSGFVSCVNLKALTQRPSTRYPRTIDNVVYNVELGPIVGLLDYAFAAGF